MSSAPRAGDPGAPGAARDLAGKTIVVTGATSGIGLETARALARRGARVVACARARSKGEAAQRDIERTTGAAPELVVFDLASMDDVRRGARELLARFDRIDVLVNNAATMHPRRELTVDGFETTFATNHLGPFLLTNLLLDRLRENTEARVVNVAARAHRRCPGLRFDDLGFARGRYVATAAYNHSKLANVAFTIELARRLHGSTVTTNALHPGVVQTELGQDGEIGGLTGIAWRLIQPLLMSPVDGAASTLHCATAPELARISGAYFDAGEIHRLGRVARNTESARRLWTISAELVRLER